MQFRSSLLLAALLSTTACGDDKGNTTDTPNTNSSSSSSGEPETSTDALTTTGTTDEPTTVEPTTDTSDTNTTPPDPTTEDPTTEGPSTTVEPDTTTTGEDTDSTGTGGVFLSYALDVYPLLAPMNNCGCHDDGAGGLVLGDVGTSYTNLVGGQANGAPLAYVEPSDHEASYFWHKINGSQNEVGGGGSTMPLGDEKLPQSTIDLIAQWIDEGALP